MRILKVAFTANAQGSEEEHKKMLADDTYEPVSYN